MDVVTNNRICRCCYAEGTFKDLISTHLWMGESEVYGDIIKECFDIHLLNIADDESSGICELCIISLRNANHFKKQVLKSEELFKKNLLEDKNSVKLEEAINAGGNVNVEVEIDHVPDYVPHKFEELELPIKSEIHFTDELTIKKKKRKLKTESNTSDKSCPVKRVIIIKPRETPTIKLVNKVDAELRPHLHNLHTVLEYSNATPFKPTVDTTFNCVFCLKNFTHASLLKSHTLKTHNHEKTNYLKNARLRDYAPKLDITSLKCDICAGNFDRIESFMDHLNLEHGKPSFLNLKNHILQFKFDSLDALSCVYCSHEFITFKKLHEHMCKVHYRNYLCDRCDGAFLNKAFLQNHSYKHRKQGTFECGECGRTFDSLIKKNAHSRNVHESNSRWRCPYCLQRFKAYRERKMHIFNIHGYTSPSLNCHACDKSFPETRLLTAHVKRFHLMERLHRCSECDMGFHLKKELLDHMYKHSDVKEFKCGVCLKAYSRKKTLAGHMRIHTNDRRFKCDYCGLTFIQKCSLRTHLRSKHTEGSIL